MLESLLVSIVGIGVLVTGISLFLSFIYILGLIYLIATDSDRDDYQEVIHIGFNVFLILLVVVTVIFMAYLIGSAILL